MKKLSAFLAKVTLLSLFFLAATPAVVPALVSDANAQSSTSASVNSNILVTTMCNMMKIVTGNAGKAIAAFAIIAVGVGFFTGKVSWGFIIPSNLHPDVLSNIDIITKEVKLKLLSEQSIIDKISGGEF